MTNEREIDQAMMDHLQYSAKYADQQVVIAMERVCSVAARHLRAPDEESQKDLTDALFELGLAHNERADALWLLEEEHEMNRLESEAAA